MCESRRPALMLKEKQKTNRLLLKKFLKIPTFYTKKPPLICTCSAFHNPILTLNWTEMKSNLWCGDQYYKKVFAKMCWSAVYIHFSFQMTHTNPKYLI